MTRFFLSDEDAQYVRRFLGTASHYPPATGDGFQTQEILLPATEMKASFILQLACKHPQDLKLVGIFRKYPLLLRAEALLQSKVSWSQSEVFKLEKVSVSASVQELQKNLLNERVPDIFFFGGLGRGLSILVLWLS